MTTRQYLLAPLMLLALDAGAVTCKVLCRGSGYEIFGQQSGLSSKDFQEYQKTCASQHQNSANLAGGGSIGCPVYDSQGQDISYCVKAKNFWNLRGEATSPDRSTAWRAAIANCRQQIPQTDCYSWVAAPATGSETPVCED